MVSNPNLPVSHRLSQPQDHHFIYVSWSSSEKFSTSHHLTPHQIYTPDERRKIYYLLSKSQVMIAYLDQEPDTILAYIAYQYRENNLLIHYAFTKSDFRRQGIQTQLLNIINLFKNPVVLTCIPPGTILKNLQKNYNIIYDSFYFTRYFFSNPTDQTQTHETTKINQSPTSATPTEPTTGTDATERSD